MNQQRRSPDEQSAAPDLEGEDRPRAEDAPLESGFAPRERGRAEHESDGEGEGDSLYERLLRSGALDEVMEVAAREQDDRGAEPLDPNLGAERGPDSEIVPAGTAAAAERTSTQELDEIDLEVVVDVTQETRATPGPEAPAKPSLELGDTDDTPVRLPPNDRAPALPSMMLGPETAPRKDSTDRVVLRSEGASRRPSLTPAQARPGGAPSRDARPMLALVALLCLTAGALLFWFATRGDRQPTRAAPSTPSAAEQARQTPESAREPDPIATAPADGTATAAEPGHALEVEAQEASAAPPPTPPAPSQAARRPAKPVRTPVPSGAEPAAEPPEVPEKPDRDHVVQVMQGLTPALEECAAGDHGDTRLVMTVQGSGRVSHAVVQGDFEGTPAGSCMALAAREARFDEFGSRFVRLTYPVRL